MKPGEQKTAQLIFFLRNRIRRARISQGRLEKRLGLANGYLSHLLSGMTNIKLWHLLGILEVLKIEPAVFMKEAMAPEVKREMDEAASAAGGADMELLHIRVRRLEKMIGDLHQAVIKQDEKEKDAETAREEEDGDEESEE